MTVTAVDPGTLSLTAAGLQARLQLAFPPSYFQFDFVPPRMSAQDWERLVQRPPFIGLGWTGFKAQANGSALFKGVSHWTLFLVCVNQSSIRARYLGDAQGSGLFQMIQAAIATLNGFKNLDVGTCMVTEASNAYAEGWHKENMVMATVELEVLGNVVSVGSGLKGAEATPNLLAAIASSWVFPQFGDQAQVTQIESFGAAA